MVEKLLSVVELAELLNVPKGTVYKLNKSGTGPKRIRVGRQVRYRRADVDRWLEKRSVTPAA